MSSLPIVQVNYTKPENRIRSINQTEEVKDYSAQLLYPEEVHQRFDGVKEQAKKHNITINLVSRSI